MISNLSFFSVLQEADGVSIEEGMTAFPGTCALVVFVAWLFYKFCPGVKPFVLRHVNAWVARRQRRANASVRRNLLNGASEGNFEMNNFGESGASAEGGNTGKKTTNVDSEFGASGSNDPAVPPFSTFRGKDDQTFLKQPFSSTTKRGILKKTTKDRLKQTPKEKETLEEARLFRERKNLLAEKKRQDKLGNFRRSNSLDKVSKYFFNEQTLTNLRKLNAGESVGGARSKVAGQLSGLPQTSTPFRVISPQRDETFFFSFNDTIQSVSDDQLHLSFRRENQHEKISDKNCDEDLLWTSPERRRQKGQRRDVFENTQTVHNKTVLVPKVIIRSPNTPINPLIDFKPLEDNLTPPVSDHDSDTEELESEHDSEMEQVEPEHDSDIQQELESEGEGDNDSDQPHHDSDTKQSEQEVPGATGNVLEPHHESETKQPEEEVRGATTNVPDPHHESETKQPEEEVRGATANVPDPHRESETKQLEEEVRGATANVPKSECDSEMDQAQEEMLPQTTKPRRSDRKKTTKPAKKPKTNVTNPTDKTEKLTLKKSYNLRDSTRRKSQDK